MEVAVVDRVRRRDLSFLSEETPETPLHNATIEIFDPGEGDDAFDHRRLLELINDRLAFVPRYRQRLMPVPGHLANPVWVDDESFDLTFHVRRSALPRPGSNEQLLDLVSRIVSRPLDRSRPLWEIYFIEGLENGRVAVLSKTHQALVDGVHTVDLGQLLLDPSPKPRILGSDDDWAPRRAPSPAQLFAGAVEQSLTSPEVLLDTVRTRGRAVARLADQSGRRTRAFVGAIANRGKKGTPINGGLSQQRRIVTLHTCLKDYRAIRDAHGGTVNDVILATIAGGLRAWLMTRAESLGGLRQVRVLVPVSVIDEELEATSLGSQIAAHFVDLPIGEASPVVRLHQVSYSFQAHKETGRSVAANRLAGVAGFAPTTFHAIGSRVRSRPCTPPAPACSAATRCRRCCPAIRWPSASRRTTAASSTASPPTATGCRTPSCSAPACARRSTSSSRCPRRPASRRPGAGAGPTRDRPAPGCAAPLRARARAGLRDRPVRHPGHRDLDPGAPGPRRGRGRGARRGARRGDARTRRHGRARPAGAAQRLR
jgi:diacylglycerol O-acyltransferase